MPWGEHECECPDYPLSVPCPGRRGIRGRCGLVALVRKTPVSGSLATSTDRSFSALSMLTFAQSTFKRAQNAYMAIYTASGFAYMPRLQQC